MRAERIKYLWIYRFICLLANVNTPLVMTKIGFRMGIGYFFWVLDLPCFWGDKEKTKVIQEPTLNDVGWVAQPVERLTTGWTVRDRIPWGRDFPPVQTGLGANPASCKMGTWSFPGLNCGRGVPLTSHPLLVSRLWKNRAIALPTLWAKPGL